MSYMVISFLKNVYAPFAHDYFLFWNKLLLKATGGSNDGSPFNNTVTSVGVTVSSAQSKFDGVSYYFDGNSRFELAQNVDTELVNVDFTISFWMFPLSLSGTQTLITTRTDSTKTEGFLLRLSGDMLQMFGGMYVAGQWATSETTCGKVKLNTWQHIVVQRGPGQARVFINGVRRGLGGITPDYVFPTPPIRIGADSDGGGFLGYMDDISYSRGIGIYRANFAVPTAPSLNYQPSISVPISPSSLTTPAHTKIGLTVDTNVVGYNTTALLNVNSRIEMNSPFVPATAEYPWFTFEAWTVLDGNKTRDAGFGAGNQISDILYMNGGGSGSLRVTLYTTGSGGLGLIQFSVGKWSVVDSYEQLIDIDPSIMRKGQFHFALCYKGWYSPQLLRDVCEIAVYINGQYVWHKLPEDTSFDLWMLEANSYDVTVANQEYPGYFGPWTFHFDEYVYDGEFTPN